MRYLAAIACLCALAPGCDSNETRGDVPAFVPPRIPNESCTELPPVAIESHGSSFVVDTSLTGYQPGRIVDVVRDTDGGLLILDASNFEVARLGADGQVVDTFGRQGRGPGEFSQPQSLAIDQRFIYVLDPDRVSVFTKEGVHVRDVRTGFLAENFAVTSSGDLVLAADVRQFGGEHGGVVVFDSTGAKKATLLEYDPAKYGKRPLTGPHFTPIRVFAGADDRVAIAYVSDNSVDIYENYRLITSIRGCLPRSVSKFYSDLGVHNRSAPPMQRSQVYRVVINSIYLDPAGDILVGSPGGWDDLAEITRYDRSGKVQQVVQFKDSDSVKFASHGRFLDSNNLVTWDGGVWRWSIAANP